MSRTETRDILRLEIDEVENGYIIREGTSDPAQSVRAKNIHVAGSIDELGEKIKELAVKYLPPPQDVCCACSK